MIDDAKAATQAALAEGIVPGGGVALLRCESALSKLKLEGDEALGVRIISNILDYPLRAIANNAGLDGAVVVNRVRQLKDKNEGTTRMPTNTSNDQGRDHRSCQVVKTALSNAASVASLLLTTESLVTEIPKEEEPAGGVGLVLAIGIVVDDAIVVVENVERLLKEGLNARDAARKAMTEVTGPVIAVALVLCAVFLPCAFISGITGQFFRQFAVTIAVSTVLSAINSLTLSPALAVLLLRPSIDH